MKQQESQNSIQAVGPTDQIGLPWDLSQWIDKGLLCEWILEDIETLDWADASLVAFLREHPDFRPRMMLALLTYSYATGVYGAEEIVENCYGDETFRSLCHGERPPSSRSIAGFRRENRGLLKWFLVQLFKRALKRKSDLDDFLVPPGLKRSLEDAATTRIDIARHIDRGARET